MPSYSPKQVAELAAQAVPGAPYVPPAWEIGSPPAWPYVSKRLAVEWMPNDPLWCSPVVSTGDVDGKRSDAYYRLSPQVLYWLDSAGAVLESRYASGAVGRDQIDAYLDAMCPLWEFARGYIDAVARENSKGLPPVLPDAAVPV